ncbi:MAG: hypothetical protein LKF53_05395 [Solobacterium sp.]|jgi:hypothetical protein|nr:hypothetical protein [Solobacterium sp.]MCH4282873.1 hypothetical protein [Solobacterium sp.]
MIRSSKRIFEKNSDVRIFYKNKDHAETIERENNEKQNHVYCRFCLAMHITIRDIASFVVLQFMLFRVDQCAQ